MLAKVRTDTTWEKDRERWSTTQHNHERQAVNLWSMQVLLLPDFPVRRRIAVTQLDIKSKLSGCKLLQNASRPGIEHYPCRYVI